LRPVQILSLAALRPAEKPPIPTATPLRSVLDALAVPASLGVSPDPAEAATLLCELAYALRDLALRDRGRAVVHLAGSVDPWQVGLERAGSDVLVSVFQGGALPDIVVHERRLEAAVLASRLLETLERAAADADLATRDRLASARDSLDACLPIVGEPAPEPAVVAVEPTGDIPIVVAADVVLRTPPTSTATPAVLRADLFALLFRGKVRITVGDRARELPEVLVFPFAEQLTAMTHDALEAWVRSTPFHRRVTVGGAICGIRLSSERAASLTLGLDRRIAGDRGHASTLPAVDMLALAQGVVAFGRALARSLVRRDRAQASNLRLVAFRTQVRELAERLREATRDDSKINAAPEGYRAYAATMRAPGSDDDSFGRTRLRFSPRWYAGVPSIDLRATFLCGDAIVVGSARELCCLDRRTGDVVWKHPVSRAATIMTPSGIARLDSNGALELRSLASGEPVWTTRLAARVGAAASGAVVSAPGLPKMLLLSEGARHLAAVDLFSGEVRWRHGTRRGGPTRLRRAGKLVVVSSGEPALTALDVLSGEVVWRFCDHLRFAAPVAVDQDALFAVAGDGAFVGRGGARLHHLDPWSGAPRWSVDLAPGVSPVGAPLLAAETVVVASHGRHGTELFGFDRATGALRFQRAACSSPASCMVVDDAVLLNSEGGELVAIDARDGEVRYRHVFGAGSDGDRPRRLEPLLRSGALFVPQNEVHVVRPRDGVLLGKVPSDLVPDLLRVDERCDVYVVEESGHLAAFAAAPRLMLVQ
jgi:outer membrane protein assembly factor BamB